MDAYDDPEALLKLAYVGELIGVTPFYLQRQIHLGRLGAYRVGREWRVSRKQLDQWLRFIESPSKSERESRRGARENSRLAIDTIARDLHTLAEEARRRAIIRTCRKMQRREKANRADARSSPGADSKHTADRREVAGALREAVEALDVAGSKPLAAGRERS